LIYRVYYSARSRASILAGGGSPWGRLASVQMCCL